MSKPQCKYKEPCCMRENGRCNALSNTKFNDGKCHFRKVKPNGVNEYDKEKKEKL